MNHQNGRQHDGVRPARLAGSLQNGDWRLRTDDVGQHDGTRSGSHRGGTDTDTRVAGAGTTRGSHDGRNNNRVDNNNHGRSSTLRHLAGSWRRQDIAESGPSTAPAPPSAAETFSTPGLLTMVLSTPVPSVNTILSPRPLAAPINPQQQLPGNQFIANLPPRYRGDLRNPRNQSADIPDDQNCATFITNLPAGCTYALLFNSFRGVGAISHAVLNRPGGEHMTCAAKVVFFERASIDRLFAQVITSRERGPIRIVGRVPIILLNRVKVAPTSRLVFADQGNGGRGSRVLQVIGDQRVVNVDGLESLLQSRGWRVTYGLESAMTFIRPNGYHVVEFRFASFRVQAERAREVFLAQRDRSDLSEEERILWEVVTCQYAPDPCE